LPTAEYQLVSFHGRALDHRLQAFVFRPSAQDSLKASRAPPVAEA